MAKSSSDARDKARRRGIAKCVSTMRSPTSPDSVGEFLVFEDGNGGRRAAKAQLVPALHHVVIDGAREFCAPGERLDELVIHAGVDQGLGAPRANLRRVEAR